MTDEDVCGYEDTTTGEPCQHPAGSCPVPTHSDDTVDENPQGRPSAFDDEQRRESLYNAVELGMKVEHQAGIAGVDETTLRRALCCVESPSDPTLTTDNPCEFCTGYVRAHSEGAMETLQNCRPEYVASATFGYSKEQDVNIAGQEDAPPLQVELNETVVETGYDE